MAASWPPTSPLRVSSQETVNGRSVWKRLASRVAPRRATPADVAFLHRLLLGRDPHPGELEACAGQDVVCLMADLATSWDHREIMRRALVEDIAWLYRELLRRGPENDDVVARRVGRPLLDVVLEFAQSEELRVRARTTTAADVETLYSRVLDRQPESAAAVTTRVGLPLLDVAMEVFQSPEVRTRRDVEFDELQELCALFLGAPLDDAWAHDLTGILRSFRLGRTALLDHLLRMRLRRHGITSTGGANGAATPPHILLREHPDHAPTRHFGPTITLIVPTVDSEPWIRSVVDTYNGIGIRPVYAVDSRTRDRTREILAATRQDWIEVSAAAPRVEALLPGILSRVSTPWVLRLDDDELPTPDLLRFCDAAVERSDSAVWGFPRLCLRWNPGRPALDYSTFLAVGIHADMDRQWRLFRPDRVRLRDILHSPGFDDATRAPAPAGALILHYDWVLRTEARRQEKIAGYEAQAGSETPRPTSIHYEAIPEEWHQFEVLDHAASLDYARRIHHASR